MNKPLDELYLEWLYHLIADPDERVGARTFWKLARQMYSKEFVWFIPNDDNRIEDGRYLRVQFTEDLGLYDMDPQWMDIECSMLELLIGLSRRLSFLGDGEPSSWFWEMIDNLGLRYSDRGQYPRDFIEEMLETVIWRLYRSDGFGGLFPLKHPEYDQITAELWYQMQCYLLERR